MTCARVFSIKKHIKKSSWRMAWQSIPVFVPEKFHGQRSLAGYSPWGCKEWDMTEHTRVHSKYLHRYLRISVSHMGAGAKGQSVCMS